MLKPMLKPILLTSILIICMFGISFGGQYQKGNSDTEPKGFVKQKDRTTVNYNIRQVQRMDIDGNTKTSWEYDWVDVEGEVTKAKFKEAVKESEIEMKDAGHWTPDTTISEHNAEKNATNAQQQEMINSQGFMILDLKAALCGEHPENALCAPVAK